jgi:hypothetical protein
VCARARSTLVIWTVSLAVGWQVFDWKQLIGFIVLLYGTVRLFLLRLCGSVHVCHVCVCNVSVCVCAGEGRAAVTRTLSLAQVLYNAIHKIPQIFHYDPPKVVRAPARVCGADDVLPLTRCWWTQFEAMKGAADDASAPLIAESPAFPSIDVLGASSPALTRVVATHAR